MNIIYFAVITLANCIGLMITGDIGIPGTLLIILLGTIGVIFSESLDAIEQKHTLGKTARVFRMGSIFSYILQVLLFLYMIYNIKDVFN